MLFSLWADAPYRATGDLDLLGAGENTPDKLASIFQEIFAVEVEDDGILFRPDTLRAAAARAEDEYAGVRIDFLAELEIGRAQVCTPVTNANLVCRLLLEKKRT